MTQAQHSNSKTDHQRRQGSGTVHTLAGTAYLVSPGLFQRYAQEHPQITVPTNLGKLPEWQWVQKQFEKLGIHRKQANGLNIWTCEVAGPRKSRRLHGYLLSEPNEVFNDLPLDNPYLRLSNNEHAARYHSPSL